MTSPRGTNAIARTFAGFNRLQVIAEALLLINTQFRIFPSQLEIVFKVYEQSASTDTKKTMQNYIWATKVIELIHDSNDPRI